MTYPYTCEGARAVVSLACSKSHKLSDTIQIHGEGTLMKTLQVLLVVTLFVVMAASPAFAVTEQVKGKCMTCHKEITAGLYYQWRDSEHALNNVTCYDCHGAKRSEVDAFMHEGAYIATMVTPKDCGACHQKESDEFQPSHHAKAGQILDSNDAY
ncbi:MAG TPA: hypothetical protein ENH10_04160, partial [Bacteroidetes bacterium]|nr:hypothetical protein [Bacteroidota bacterium]HEX04338.1 hypothetical protein [Bacteroidota bacterium]